MPTPYMHDAQRALMEAEMRKMPPPEQAKVQVVGDPLRSFEYEKHQVQTDFRLWHTFLPEDRRKKTQRLAERRECSQAIMVRDMNYIIWIESHKEGGDKETATIAFRRLFPAAVRSWSRACIEAGTSCDRSPAASNPAFG